MTFLNVFAREMPFQFLGKSAGEYLARKNSWYKKAMHASITIIKTDATITLHMCMCLGMGWAFQASKSQQIFPVDSNVVIC